MPMPRPRYTIGRLMIVVAVAGVLCAWLLRVPGAGVSSAAGVILLAPAAIGLAYPVFVAKPGRRLLAANWVVALWPLTIPWSLHVPWAVAYAWLGHPPGYADNVPWDALPGISVLFFGLLSMGSTVACLWLSWVLARERAALGIGWFRAAFPVVLNLLAWGSALGICGLDPVNALVWFMD